MLPVNQIALRLAVALGIGLLIGIERERRKGQGRWRAAAGIRTFALASLLGAVSFQLGREPLLVAMALVIGGLTILSYTRTCERDPGLTTESALLLTVVLGALAMREPALASASAVVVAILLAARNRLHFLVRTALSDDELHQGLIFAAAVIVVLPLMPNRYLGPFDVINPRTIWKFVVLMMSVSAAGHIGSRILGAKLGLPLAGLAGGFASSAATIAAMGSRMKDQPSLARPATAGAVLSSIATIVELALVLAATNRAVLATVRVPLMAAGLAALIYGVTFTVRALVRAETNAAAPKGAAFDLRTTGVLAVTVTVVTMFSALINARFGRSGLTLAAAIAGFVDAHSAGVSAASLVASGKIVAADAALPVLAALTTNTITKAVLAFTAGGRVFAARVVPGLVAMIAASWIGLLL